MYRNKSASSRFGRNSSSNNFHRSFGKSFFRSAPKTRSPYRSNKRRGETIDISRFINKSNGFVSETITPITNSFADFAFYPELHANLKRREYNSPTPIQDQSINSILDGRDIIGLASTGTGKTAAFLLPLINKVFRNRGEKVLIITPTRELAQQVETEFRQFSWDMKIFSCACVGGLPIYKQITMLKRHPNFIIGTPGRLKDLAERGSINFNLFNTIVLDEVDRMLDMGFVDEITEVLKAMPENKQSLFFSATMPDKIRNLVKNFLKDPVTIEIKSRETAENVDQDIIRVENQGNKLLELKKLLAKPEVEKVLIFSETKREVETLTDNLIGAGLKAESIHGDKKQHQRQRALAQFRDNQINILVATDVAARGLDIKDVTHVINYTIPQTYNDYVHRIGRTGRWGKTGCALTFVESR